MELALAETERLVDADGVPVSLDVVLSPLPPPSVDVEAGARVVDEGASLRIGSSTAERAVPKQRLRHSRAKIRGIRAHMVTVYAAPPRSSSTG